MYMYMEVAQVIRSCEFFVTLATTEGLFFGVPPDIRVAQMAQMCRGYRAQWISHCSYPVGQENALKPPKSKWLIPAKIISRYGRFQ